ncbi:MAG: esterase-like activity of phytase family protein, partial [Lachnospiraceae bacterium]|nr:esterase-like activity of phytase family protein [Lachnospiraceae bacterium]
MVRRDKVCGNRETKESTGTEKAILSNRIPNRGFEGLTITPSGKVIASVQSVLDVNGETSKKASFVRFVEFDP